MADAEGIKDAEIWKSIPGYEGLYSVSSHGKIRRDKSGRILKPSREHGGYLRVDLSCCGMVKTARVHRLVLSAFVGIPPVKMDANHKNGRKEDNSIANLEWMTHAENLLHSYHVLKTPHAGVAVLGKKKPNQTLREYHDLAKKHRGT